jgi:hypothetical protein
MSKDDLEVVARAIEDALASDDMMPETIARAAIAVDPRVIRLSEALRLICNQTDGSWAIKLARAALAETEKP